MREVRTTGEDRTTGRCRGTHTTLLYYRYYILPVQDLLPVHRVFTTRRFSVHESNKHDGLHTSTHI